LYVNDLVEMPVFDSEDEAGLFLGYVFKTLLNRERTKVVGFAIRMRSFRPKRAFPFKALRWVEDEFFLVETKEVRWLPRQRELYKVYVEEKQDKLLEAVEGDTVVGKVTDFIFDSSTGEIVKVQIDRGLLRKLINIPRSDIITLTEETAVLREGAVSEATKPTKKPTRKPAETLLDHLAVKTARGLATVTYKVKKRLKK
jgi:uncharacterized protein YrrD